MRERDLKPFRNQFHIQNGNIPLSPLHIRQEAAIQSNLLCELDLRPASLLSQGLNPRSELDQQVLRGHPPASCGVAYKQQIVFTQQSC